MTVRSNTSYRNSAEQWILFLTCLAVFFVILLSAALTFRFSLAVIAVGVLLAYVSTRVKHVQLVSTAILVTDQSAAALAEMARQCVDRMGSEAIQLYIARSDELNAYTFGLLDPKIVVLYSALFHEMDADEIRFILGHELGHICLGHTWLNSIIGGMAGLPSTFLVSSLLKGIFLWWNRACEYSADRAGLLACGRVDKALSALIKLAAGPGGIRSQPDLQRVLQLVESETDDPLNTLKEMMATHPMIIHRMKVLEKYAASFQYRHLKSEFD